MITEKTTYQSKNWDKRLSQWCKENRRAKSIRKSLTKKQKDQIQKDLNEVASFVKQTLINMNNK
mgnify:FL=1